MSAAPPTSTRAPFPGQPDAVPPYLSGLRLAGRRVVVVGGGSVAQRRIPTLLAAGAVVHVVSPVVTPAIEGMLAEITWTERGFEPADLDGAWYVVAATDVREVNEAVSAAAEERRMFCVRSDDGTRASAWTPASGRYGGVTVGVLTEDRRPLRAARVRDQLLGALQDGTVRLEQAERPAAGVVLVGGGPGDPELVTLAALRALLDADVVVADRLAPREVLAMLPPSTELVDVAKLPRGRAALQEEINRVLVDRAREGKRVVRFKGGDSFVFGRGFEEVLACREAGVPVSVVPGVSSALAVPSTAGIPITHRGVAHEAVVVSGHLPPGHPDSLVEWDALGRLRGTLVLLMAVQNAAAIATALLAGGRTPSTPVALVQEGTMPTEQTVVTTLDRLAAEGASVRAPAVIVVGDVVAVAHPDRTASDG